MADKKSDKEFATKQREPADDSGLEAKLERQAKKGPVTVLAKDVNSLNPEAGPDCGEKQVQKQFDAEAEAGVRGIVVDPTPNENYTVSGVIKGAPTPETSEGVRSEANAARRIDGPEPLS